MAQAPAAPLGAPVIAWLLGEARGLPDANALLTALSGRLIAQGVPLASSSFNMQLLHPHLFGVGIYWRKGADAVQVFSAERGTERSPSFLNSPMGALYEGAAGVRQRLDLPDTSLPFPLLYELRAEGLTDYAALPLAFSDGKLHGTSWASDRPGGFATADLALIESLLPVVSLLLEIHVNRRLAITLLDTYVGHNAGRRILDGQITRGSGETVPAAIWYCDLQGFTELSERSGRDLLIALLNDYFDCMATPVARRGGEILKFIGDAMLAIFPMDGEGACARALEAALEARRAMAELNRKRRAGGHHALGFGIALHVGEVMYGNIGGADRLDFTVIGPAVNLASRIERLCRTLGPDVLISKDFAARCPRAAALRSVGAHRLPGVRDPVEVFTLPEAA